MTSLTFYGGVNEIGGNKILVEDQGTRVFLDFGMSFSIANQYFDEFMQPRKCNGILDLLEFGLLPNLKGLYRCDYQSHCSLSPDQEPAFDGVLLSHAHMDHCSYVHYLREDIPLYCTQGAKDIMQALDETGSTGTCELISLKESFQTYVNSKGGESKLQGEKAKKPRPYNIVESSLTVGGLDAEALPVSHSLEGATAYILHTNLGPVVYTGDFRFHGYKGDETRRFVERAAAKLVVVLVVVHVALQLFQSSDFQVFKVGDTATSNSKHVNAVVSEPILKTWKQPVLFHAYENIVRLPFRSVARVPLGRHYKEVSRIIKPAVSIQRPGQV